jgi:mono/diheme cytochrome c family protein
LKFTFANAAVLILAASIFSPAFSQTPGADTYKQSCATCHGADGQSKTPVGQAMKAANLKDPAIAHLSDEELLAIIKNGKNSMPAFGSRLSDAQINAVIAHLRTLQK